MLTKLFLTVLNMSITGAVTILVVLLVRLLLKPAPKAFSYALWAVVLLRLLCPVMLASPASLWNLLKAPAAETGGMVYVAPTSTPTVLTPPPTLPPDSPAAMPAAPAPVYEAAPAPAPVVTPAAAVTPMQMLAWVWLAGAAILLAYSLWKLLRLRRKLVGAVLLEGNVYLADGIESPFVMGLFRPKIYLPFSLNGQERDYILLHERCHIRRGDHAVKLLAFLALCIHWFDPLVWLAFILSGQDMEMRCDEAVLKALGEDIRADYSASLLSLATGRRIIAGTPLAFGEGDPKRRIKNVLHYKKPAFWIVIAAVAACAVAALVLLTDPVKKRDDPAAELTPPPVQVEDVSHYDAPMLWFDDLKSQSENDGPQVAAMFSPHWPGQLYRDTDTNQRIYTLEGGAERTVIGGMPILNAYLLDLNGDGAPEVCATASYGYGVAGQYIKVYDYVNDKAYVLRGDSAYHYSLEEKDGRLSVVQWDYADGSARAAAWPLQSLDDLTSPVQIDPGTPPTLEARSMAERHSGGIQATRYGYHWAVKQSDGTMLESLADAPDPMANRSPNMRVLTLDPAAFSSVHPLDVFLAFGGPRAPDEVTVERWSINDYGPGYPAGTPVPVDWSYGIVFRATEAPSVYVVEAVWRENGDRWGRCTYAFEVQTIWTEETTVPDAELPMQIWDGSEYVQPALAMSAARTWTEEGWLHADGLPLEHLLEANANSMPTVVWNDRLNFRFGDGVTALQLSVFREDFSRVEDFVLVDQPGVGEGFGRLAPGTYYVADRVSVHGQHIEAAGDSEYVIYWCMFRLIVG